MLLAGVISCSMVVAVGAEIVFANQRLNLDRYCGISAGSQGSGALTPT
jgi:hypothetical protein